VVLKSRISGYSAPSADEPLRDRSPYDTLRAERPVGSAKLDRVMPSALRLFVHRRDEGVVPPG
jgi:hypothetical protein